MEEVIKLLKKYFTIIITFIVVLGLISNKDKLGNIFHFWMNILRPIAYGTFLAYILSPLQKKILSKLKVKYRETLSIVITYIIFFIVVISLGALCIPQIINSLTEIINKLPSIYDNFILLISQYGNDGEYVEILNEKINEFWTYLSTILPDILNWLGSIFKTSAHMLMAIIVSIYLLVEKESIKNGIKRLSLAYLKEEKTKILIENFKDCEKILNKFIMAKLLDSAIIGVLCAILMAILKMDYIVLISLLVGITNMIPYVGPFIGGAFGIIILFASSSKTAFIFLIMIIALQQFDGNILGPKILGGKVGVKPLWIMVSLMIGGALGGIVGMFLGTPVIAIILYLVNKDIDKRINKENENGGK